MNDELRNEIKQLIREELEKFKQSFNPEIQNMNAYLEFELNNQTQELENEYNERFKKSKIKKEEEYNELFQNIQDIENNKEQLYIDIHHSKLFDITDKSIIILIDFSLDKMYNRTVSFINIVNNFIKNNNNITVLSKHICPTEFVENINDNCRFINLNNNKDQNFFKI